MHTYRIQEVCMETFNPSRIPQICSSFLPFHTGNSLLKNDRRGSQHSYVLAELMNPSAYK